MTTIILWSGLVPVDATDIIASRIDRLAKRAERQGFPVPSPNYGVETLADGVKWVGLQIVSDGLLRLGDYEFVGTISVLEDGSPFVTYAPGVERAGTPEYTHPYRCDHCETNRNRTNTYIVRGADGYHQVGSSCIKDFTGHSPAAIVGWLDAVDSLSFSDDEISGWGRSATRFYSPSEIIGIASRIVSKAGYVSKQKAEDEDKQATAELIREFMSANSVYRRDFEARFPVTPESETLYFDTMSAIEAAVGQPASSDWTADIIRLASSSGVQWRHIGILGSAVILGMRKQERAAISDRPEGRFFGEIGQRLTLTGCKVLMKRSFEGSYGQSFVIRFDVDGNDALWFASWSEATEALSEGDTIGLVATVKAHELDSRSSRPTTVLTRCIIHLN